MTDGFDPVFDENSEVLILGSFPSVVSREVGFYYGNARNRFWKLIGEIFGEKIPVDTEGKKAFLLKNKIALWDICSRCEIRGSLDSAIKSPVVSDLAPIMEKSKIRLIILNGKKSYELYRKHYDYPVKTVCLPSTSPANIAFDGNEWKKVFSEII